VKTLANIADDAGNFAIIAMDQRNTLRRMFESVGEEPTDQGMRQAKVDVARFLSPNATGLLLDPTFGVPAVLEAGALADTCGLLVAAEPSERGNFNGEPRAHRIESQGGQWVLDQGGDAVKFLVQVNALRVAQAGEPDLVAEVLDVVRGVVEDCRAAGIPSVIENLVYSLPGEEKLTGARKAEAIIESAALLSEIGMDLLKLEYPGSPEACRRLSSVLTVPWAVLSAGVDFEEFTDVLKISCDEGGASGFIAGRALWKESIGMSAHEREAFFTEVSVPRLEACRQAIAGRATSWSAAVSVMEGR
jgi:tagatose-1,6-bisphosphate aldolase